MKRLFLVTALAAGLICPLAAHADQKIGIVDLAKVFDQYYKTIRSNIKFKAEAADMDKERKEMIDNGKKQEEEWQKLIDKSEDQAVSAEERERSKKEAQDKLAEIKSSEQAIQEYDRVSAAKLREENRQRRDDIVKEIRSVLNADAKAGDYTLVLDVSGESANMAPVVLFSNGSNDLTDNLIKELNAAAPALTPDEKQASGAK
jgi:Skp family chaperone for outer membrane proteins